MTWLELNKRTRINKKLRFHNIAVILPPSQIPPSGTLWDSNKMHLLENQKDTSALLQLWDYKQ